MIHKYQYQLFEEFSNDKHFNCLFQPRQFMKSTKNNCKNTVTKLSQEELFADVKNKKFLIEKGQERVRP